MATKTKATKTKPDDATTRPAPRDPTQWIGIDHDATGTYVYEDAPMPPYGRERLLTRDHPRGAKHFEVCATDDDGCWLYRYSPV